MSLSLSMILGFAEDYCKIAVHGKRELILNRSKTDVKSVTQTQIQGQDQQVTRVSKFIPLKFSG